MLHFQTFVNTALQNSAQSAATSTKKKKQLNIKYSINAITLIMLLSVCLSVSVCSQFL